MSNEKRDFKIGDTEFHVAKNFEQTRFQEFQIWLILENYSQKNNHTKCVFMQSQFDIPLDSKKFQIINLESDFESEWLSSPRLKRGKTVNVE